MYSTVKKGVLIYSSVPNLSYQRAFDFSFKSNYQLNDFLPHDDDNHSYDVHHSCIAAVDWWQAIITATGRLPTHHSRPRPANKMGGINRGRPATHRSGGYCVCSGHIRRTVLTCFLVWASSVALIFITAVGASSPSGDSFVHAHGPADIEEHPSTRVNPSISINITEEPICWETEGPHERDCFHAEPLTAETYPLTREMLERASSRYTTTGLSLQRAFQRARKRGMAGKDSDITCSGTRSCHATKIVNFRSEQIRAVVKCL